MIGQDFYPQLIAKMGYRDARNFLVSNHPKSVMSKLFEGLDPDQYPIAYNNKCFRYLDDKGTLVEDKTGKIATKLTEHVQNAMITATNELINESIKNNTTDQLYDVYDIATVQTNLTLLSSKDELREQLIKLIENPTHPFFEGTCPSLALA
mgnify:FL=1